ncbi:hypothetical protein GOODEAATRI_033871 [Goodea atripinnis]|uniref:Uncharacterized protein n=1 Tax=Goodea atripinnis TaxID=208336 RepID=A0ABV0MXB9_9TELE
MQDLNTERIEALAHSLQLQEKVQAQFTDLEAAQGKTIYASSEFPRGLKATTIQDFIEEFIQTQLCHTINTLNLQWCHPSLGAKPAICAGLPPRIQNKRTNTPLCLENETDTLRS